jgi:hypothetical protein
MIKEPTVLEFIETYGKAVRGVKDDLADTHRGSMYEVLGGVSAIIWSRQTQRDTDLFNATQFETAVGDDLTEHVRLRDGIERIVDSYGDGETRLTRASAAAGAGTIWAGTQILLFGSTFTEAKYYVTTEDVAVSASGVTASVPIRATKKGVGWKVDAGLGAAKIDDPLWDNTWVVQSIRCEDGTLYEEASDFRARVRKARIDNRVGYRTALVKVCAEVGASEVALFASDFGGDAEDRGICHIYVADAGFSTPTTLLNACKVALESCRVLGDNTQVLPMQKYALEVYMDIYLAGNPAIYDISRMRQVITDAIVQYIGGSNGRYTYDRDGIAAAVYRVSPAVQEVEVTSPFIDGPILTNYYSPTVLNFPSTLNRYTLAPSAVVLTFYGPQ